MSKGTPFRDAYKEVGLNLDKLESVDPLESIQKKTHSGATGNLNLESAEKELKTAHVMHEEQVTAFANALKKLTGLENLEVYRTPLGKSDK